MNEYETLNDACAAVAQAGASVGVMMVKAGPKKTQKMTPFKAMSQPFGEDVLVDGVYPQMPIRLRCDRLHDPIYESVRNTGRQSGLVSERDDVRGGVSTCMVLQLACCKHCN